MVKTSSPHSSLQRAHVRLDRLGINSWEKRIYVLSDGNEVNFTLAENFRQDAASGAVHAINCEFELRFGDQIKVRKAAHRLHVGGLQIGFFDRGLLAFGPYTGRGFFFDDLHDCGCR